MRTSWDGIYMIVGLLFLQFLMMHSEVLPATQHSWPPSAIYSTKFYPLLSLTPNDNNAYKNVWSLCGMLQLRPVQPLSLQNRFTNNWNNSLWMRDYYRLFWHFLLREVIFRDIDCFLVSFVLEFLGFFLNFRNFFLTLRNSKWKWKYKSIKMA